jgi:hypothetical protein
MPPVEEGGGVMAWCRARQAHPSNDFMPYLSCKRALDDQLVRQPSPGQAVTFPSGVPLQFALLKYRVKQSFLHVGEAEFSNLTLNFSTKEILRHPPNSTLSHYVYQFESLSSRLKVICGTYITFTMKLCVGLDLKRLYQTAIVSCRFVMQSSSYKPQLELFQQCMFDFASDMSVFLCQLTG